jgi:hypothetical protein
MKLDTKLDDRISDIGSEIPILHSGRLKLSERNLTFDGSGAIRDVRASRRKHFKALLTLLLVARATSAMQIYAFFFKFI